MLGEDTGAKAREDRGGRDTGRERGRKSGRSEF